MSHDTVSHAVYARSSRRPGTHTSTYTAKCRMELVRRLHKGIQRSKEEVQVDYSKDGLGVAGREADRACFSVLNGYGTEMGSDRK